MSPSASRVNTGVDVKGAGFALEVWSTSPGSSVTTQRGRLVRVHLLLFISGGVLGDFTIENGAVTFVLQNAATKDGTGWGVGPYDVVPDATGTASPLLLAMDPKDHLHVQYTTIAPRSRRATAPRLVLRRRPPPRATRAPGVPPTPTPGQPHGLQASSITADPTTAWTAGQHVVLGDGSKARWTGTAWAAA